MKREKTEAQIRTWASNQRRAWKEGRLSVKKIKKLKDIGFVFQKTPKPKKVKIDRLSQSEKIRVEKKQKLMAMITAGATIKEIKESGLFLDFRSLIKGDEFRWFVEENDIYLLLPFSDSNKYAIDAFEDCRLDDIGGGYFSFLNNPEKKKYFRKLTSPGSKWFDSDFVNELVLVKCPWYFIDKRYKNLCLSYKYRDNPILACELYNKFNLVGKTVEQLKDAFGLPDFEFVKDGGVLILGWKSLKGRTTTFHIIYNGVSLKEDWSDTEKFKDEYANK